MARIDARLLGQGAEPLQAAPHRRHVAPREIGTPAAPHEEDVARDHVAIGEEARPTDGMAWRAQRPHPAPSDRDVLPVGAVFDAGPGAAQRPAHVNGLSFVDHDGRIDLLQQGRQPLDVVIVTVSDERLGDPQSTTLGLIQQAIDLPGRIDERRLAGLRTAQDLAEVLQEPDLDLEQLGRGGEARRVGPGIGYAHGYGTSMTRSAAPTLSALSVARTTTAWGPRD